MAGLTNAAGSMPRVSVTALGCKVNYAEMADLAGQLAALGCNIVAENDSADVRVLNSCTVTLQADATTRQRLLRLRRQDPTAHIVLTGCSVDANPQRYLGAGEDGVRLAVPGVDAVFSNAEKPAIAEHIAGLFADLKPPLHIPSAQGRSRAFLKVQDGCDHRCTYCIVWQARGASISHPLDEVLARARTAIETGQQEVVLTGVDLGSYGRDLGTTLAGLVRQLLAMIGDNARLRLSSINANDISAELAELNLDPRLCSHWHIPLQSGSDRVLKAMHRGYRRRQFLGVVEALRAADPCTEITTDVMVGFPGETETDHAATVSLLEEIRVLHSHTFRWSPRPGTPAGSLVDRVDDATAHRRSREVRRCAARSAQAARARAIGRQHQVVWCRVEDGAAEGLAATWHTVVADAGPSTRTGGLELVDVVAVEGDRLRGRLSQP